MALNDIISAIITDAEREAAELTGAAEDAAKRIRTDAEEEAQRLEAAAETAHATAAAQAAARVTSKAAHHVRLTRETARTEVVTAVFDRAASLLNTLPDAEYRSFIEKRAHALSGLSGVVTVPHEREAETKKALSSSGIAEKVVVAPKGSLIGGFILETDDALYDYSFATLLARAHEVEGARLAQALFV